VISKGTLTASIVHPRESFRPAVRNAASGVIFAHNHPSGDPLPSDEDRRITGRLEEVGRILGIPVLDHVIMGTSGSYYSFADSGEIEPQPGGYRGMVLR
jgi:DNA repair protein RadC